MDPFICGGTSDNGTFGTCKNTTASYDCTCKDGYTMSTRNVTYNNTDQAPYMMEGPTCVGEYVLCKNVLILYLYVYGLGSVFAL